MNIVKFPFSNATYIYRAIALLGLLFCSNSYSQQNTLSLSPCSFSPESCELLGYTGGKVQLSVTDDVACDVSDKLCKLNQYLEASRYQYPELNLCSINQNNCTVLDKHEISSSIEDVFMMVVENPDDDREEFEFNVCKYWPEVCVVDEGLDGDIMAIVKEIDDEKEFEFNVCKYWPETCSSSLEEYKPTLISMCDLYPSICKPAKSASDLKEYIGLQINQQIENIEKMH